MPGESTELRMYMPAKIRWVMARPSRYKVLDGGRGAAKSYSFANCAIARATTEKIRFLCTRETQNSIKDSVHRLIADRINTSGLSELFTIRNETIEGKNGSQFFFKGLHHNISEIKSMEGIDVVWVEEAEKVSMDSWDTLIPTIRKDNSEIWISFNPETKSATYRRFIENPPPDCRRAHVTFRDNKYFPDVLRREMEYDKRVDYDKYLHIWEGQIKKYAEDLIFRSKLVTDAEFDTPTGVQFYFGEDFGYSNDPTCLIRCYIQDNCLYIDWEAYGYQVEITQLHQFNGIVPDSEKWKITADSQRPDTINFLSQTFLAPNGTIYPGFSIIGAEKGKGSVEDGIEFLRSFEKIYIHKRCPGSKKDFENYRWKRDRITDEILPIAIDKSNHSPDAVRYALEDYIKRKVTVFDLDYSKINVIPTE